MKRNVPISTLALALSALLGSAAAQADTLYVTDDRVNVSTITKFAPDGTRTLFASGLSRPFGLAFDRSGNLYAANNSIGTIVKIAPNGLPSLFASGLSSPGGLAFDRSGNLYVGGDWGTITKIAPDGTATLFASGLNHPAGLAFDGHGNLYAANYAGGTITKFASDGSPSLFASGLNQPGGLAFDASGNLYAACLASDTIAKVAPDGTKSLFASGLGAPFGLAFDRSGVLYVAYLRNNTIERFDVAGNDLGVFVSVTNANYIAFDYFLPEGTGMSITTQPKSQLGYWGRDVAFSVAVTNATPPVTYQWRKDLAPLLDATNATLVLTNLQATNAGSYTVVVTDAVTNITSLPATLTVNPAGVSIALYAGVTIDGVTNQTYGVQSTLDLSNTNSWVGRANVTLTNATQLWYDSQPATQPQTYYRIVPGPISTP